MLESVNMVLFDAKQNRLRAMGSFVENGARYRADVFFEGKFAFCLEVDTQFLALNGFSKEMILDDLRRLVYRKAMHYAQEHG